MNTKIANRKLRWIKHEIVSNRDLTTAEIKLECFGGGVANVSVSIACDGVITQKKCRGEACKDKYNHIDSAFGSMVEFVKSKKYTGSAGLQLQVKGGVVCKILQVFSSSVG